MLSNFKTMQNSAAVRKGIIAESFFESITDTFCTFYDH